MTPRAGDGNRPAGRRRPDYGRRLAAASLRTLGWVMLFAAGIVATLYAVGFLVFMVAS